MEVAHFIFGIFGNATALFLFLSPIITFRRVIRNKTTEDFSGVPYNMTLLNCLLSAWYGLPFVSPNNLLVSTINGIGVFIEVIYVLIFLIYAPRKARARMFGLLALVCFVFAGVALISMLALHGNSRKLLCGSTATIFSICMYASPLSIMVPNGCGSTLGAVQLILYVIYRKSKGGKGTGADPGLSAEAMEMGRFQQSPNNSGETDVKRKTNQLPAFGQSD